MNKLHELRNASTKTELASLLGLNPIFLTKVLYRLRPETQYNQFSIPKKNGGKRIINAPSVELKSLQSNLSTLLLDCIDEINKIRFPEIETNKKQLNKKQLNKSKILKIKLPNTEIKQLSLSHGFVRERSIITNAMMHVNQKNVLNIDLKDFFDSFNFGRVRGFFIKNKHFELNPNIATVIAQIACYDNKLPQGSPCSPVITNLITHSLDIRLASIAKKHSCVYSRYADDITFSTRKSVFPINIMQQIDGEYIASKNLTNEITRAGFSINDKKTRIQYKDSRQDVTGLIVNQKPNVKKEYWRTVKSQCHNLFQTGSFTKKVTGEVLQGNINELEGQLNFIDQVDVHNRLRQKPTLNPIYAIHQRTSNTASRLSGRERTFSRFLYYRLFYGNTKPTILCEGKTDNVYLKSAISSLVASYPQLAKAKTKDTNYELLIRFIEYSKRTRFLLELHGGTAYLTPFIIKFDKHHKFYKAPQPQQPVIIVLDNDTGFPGIESQLKKNESIAYPTTLKKDDYRNADFIHVIHNLYIVLTPLTSKGKYTDIEYLFDDATRLEKYDGRCFNTVDKRNKKVDLSKDSFAQHIIKMKKNTINFNGVKPLLDRIVKAIKHYDSIKSLK